MTITPWLGYLGGCALIGVASRLWVVYKRDRRARRAYAATLFDPKLLDEVLTPHDDEDADVLAELREVLGHLNRQTFAEELWRIDDQLAAYYDRLLKPGRLTLRAALMRLLRTDDPWLRLISAKTSARLGIAEAAPEIEAVIQSINSSENPSESDRRLASELETSLSRMERA